MGNPNTLYFGDCLDIMQRDIDSESVDLIYLDPPFNSKKIYNQSMGGEQKMAFRDTWRWSQAVEDFHDVAKCRKLAPTMEGLRTILGEGTNLAYLSYMANRLRECRRVLKRTGSIYLHCDPTMNYLLRVVMNAVFGHQNFRNECVWNYYNKMHDHRKKMFASATDTLLFYVKDVESDFTFRQVQEKRKSPVKQLKRKKVKGKMVNARDENGNVIYRVRTHRVVDNVWRIPCMQPASKDWRHYDTQKHPRLLQRVIEASSKAGDIVLDPFCGCGTSIISAQQMSRQWIEIDICLEACQTVEDWFTERFHGLWAKVNFVGRPKTLTHAEKLASIDPFRFETWAAALTPYMEPNRIQRRDKGIDGEGRYPLAKGRFADMVAQVKGGKTQPRDIQAFDSARRQVRADMGVFTCFERRVTQGILDTAASMGRFLDVPRVQIYTPEDYFEGRQPRMPLAA